MVTPSFLQRSLPERVLTGKTLADVGGRMIAPGLWAELRGMEDAKEIIERRVILPLERPELAGRHGVVSPKAIILFGPPGTGKTTFAKGIASRLQWPFVEIQPAEIGGEGEAPGQAPGREPRAGRGARGCRRLRGRGRGSRLDAKRVAEGEPERHQRVPQADPQTARGAAPSARLRDELGQPPGRCLRAARTLRLRAPGRPARPRGREAIWSRYVDEITDEQVDAGALVAASELFTPADIEFSARKAAQLAFEREHFDGAGSRATTEDFLAAIRATKPSLTPEIVADFEEDTKRFARD